MVSISKHNTSSAFDRIPVASMEDLNCVVCLDSEDNSSCDSGVTCGSCPVATTSLAIVNSPNPLADCLSASRRRKPATPHRIVCPSPIKCAPRIASPVADFKTAVECSPNKGKTKSISREQSSPRKSPRHQKSTTASKTRRRLNQPQVLHVPYNEVEIEEKPLVQITSELPETKQSEGEAGLNQLEEFISFTAPNIVASHNKQLKAPPKKVQGPKIKQKNTPLATSNGNMELTQFFPVRRSVRKTKTAVKEEMMRSLEQAVLEERAEGLKVAHFEGKGRGVVAERRFQRGEFVVEYIGDLISMAEAAKREQRYALDENAGCYMYYFKHKNQQYCIDATVDTGKLGRLVNHSRNGNLVTKVVEVKRRPHLILVAKDDIEAGEEFTYDYGDRSKESLLHHPWLAF